MVTNPVHNPCGGHPCLDFVNTVDYCRAGLEQERLRDYADLVDWSQEAGHVDADEARVLDRVAARRATAARQVLVRAHALRAALQRLLAPDDRPPPPEALATLNAELARALPHARLETTGTDLAWRWEPAGEALDAPLRPIARAAAELLVSPERALVKECGGENCGWLFLDRSRNGARRWCEMRTCGNREKVRALRARRRRR
jgi:predicted RNA-binding Zn ribbon-like protein